MTLEWLKTGIGPLKDLLTFLNKEGKTNDVLKKQVIRELRNNLNIFHNAYLNNVSHDVMIDLLANEAIKEAIKNNFKFKKLKPGSIEPYHVYDDRNRKYIGWDTEKLIDKIDEKIEELKLIKRMNGNSVEKVKNNISLMLSNLYYRMKLLADDGHERRNSAASSTSSIGALGSGISPGSISSPVSPSMSSHKVPDVL